MVHGDSGEGKDMSLRLRTECRTESNALSKVSAKPFLYLVGLISFGTLLVSCATPELLGDKEESARRSGRGAVIGIHQGLDSIDDPVVTKWRAVLLEDAVMQRMVTQLVQAAVGGPGRVSLTFAPTKARRRLPTRLPRLWTGT